MSMAKGGMSETVYAPKLLRTMTEICKAFGVGPTVVKAWAAQGAPIAVEGEKKNTRYSTELVRLQIWREGQRVQVLGS